MQLYIVSSVVSAYFMKPGTPLKTMLIRQLFLRCLEIALRHVHTWLELLSATIGVEQPVFTKVFGKICCKIAIKFSHVSSIMLCQWRYKSGTATEASKNVELTGKSTYICQKGKRWFELFTIYKRGEMIPSTMKEEEER